MLVLITIFKVLIHKWMDVAFRLDSHIHKCSCNE